MMYETKSPATQSAIDNAVARELRWLVNEYGLDELRNAEEVLKDIETALRNVFDLGRAVMEGEALAAQLDAMMAMRKQMCDAIR